MDYDNVTLQLKKQENQLNELEKVKARAEIRTKRRILEQQENLKMKELEKQVVEKKSKEAKKPTQEKGKK